MNSAKNRGFIGLDAGIAIAIVLMLGLSILGGYKAYHKDAQDGMNAASSTPAASTTTPARPQQPEPGAGQVTATTSPLIITAADSGKTIRMHVGDAFILKLGGALSWGNVKFTDNGVVTAVPTFAAIPGAQGMYEARGKGISTLTATGAPVCKQNEACPQFIALFAATIVVD